MHKLLYSRLTSVTMAVALAFSGANAYAKVEDDTITPGAAISETGNKVKFLPGPYSSGRTKAMAPVTEKYKIPMIGANRASQWATTKAVLPRPVWSEHY